MNTTKLLVSASAIIIACASFHASASSRVYKWKDKDGVIHYSQNAPQGESAEVITTKTPRTPLPETNQAPSTAPAAANTPAPAANSTAKTPEKTEEPAFKKDQATCDKITKDLETLQQQPIVTMNGKVMSIEEKNAHLKVLQDGQKANCP